MIVYISGKYTDVTEELMDANIEKAKRVAVTLWSCGYTVICPHLNTIGFYKEPELVYLTHNDYIKRDLEIISKCDALLMLDNWTDSLGAIEEHNFALKNDITIFYNVTDLLTYVIPKNDFIHYYKESITKATSLVYKSKAQDYNSGGVKITDYWILGIKSLLHMVNQKCLRLKSLILSETIPNNESIEDNALDLINYAGFLYAQLQLEKEE